MGSVSFLTGYLFVRIIVHVLTSIKHPEFLHFYFHCYYPGSDHLLSYVHHRHSLRIHLPSTMVGFSTHQQVHLSMSLLYFSDLFTAPWRHMQILIMRALVLTSSTTSSHGTSALSHHPSRHTMVPSAPLSKHVLKLGSLEEVISHTSVLFQWVWNQLG